MRPAREQGEAETSAPSAGLAGTHDPPPSCIVLAGGTPKAPKQPAPENSTSTISLLGPFPNMDHLKDGAGVGMVPSQAKECQETPEAGQGKESLPWVPQRVRVWASDP